MYYRYIILDTEYAPELYSTIMLHFLGPSWFSALTRLLRATDEAYLSIAVTVSSILAHDGFLSGHRGRVWHNRPT